VPFKKLLPIPPSGVRILPTCSMVSRLSVWNSKDASAKTFQVLASFRWNVVPMDAELHAKFRCLSLSCPLPVPLAQAFAFPCAVRQPPLA
jgi:hypothetical protein